MRSVSIPDWQLVTDHSDISDSVLLDWLRDTGSLTRRLMAAGNDDFRVEVLAEQQQPARADEAAALGLAEAHPVWVREVLLHTAGAPRVFARTVADLQAFNAAGVHLENLGSRSLGELLFNDPRIRRAPIEISRYPARWLPADRQQPGCWARRSLFASERLQLLVCEVFLPGWPPAA
ncbi:chorismate--pyruvate lyase family protein [Halopseudomonas bauzanensis]|uniref:chorismate--pyruvate lyase family protein n=1 Tax=Halopseudomonas bauzanensis TaxID=653930 RepID=UPI0009426731|nr:chorismate lyase [Halopseudomonas bauzanensis]